MDAKPKPKVPEGSKFCPFLSTQVLAIAQGPPDGVVVPGTDPRAGKPVVTGVEVVPIVCHEYGMPCALWDEERKCCGLKR